MTQIVGGHGRVALIGSDLAGLINVEERPRLIQMIGGIVHLLPDEFQLAHGHFHLRWKRESVSDENLVSFGGCVTLTEESTRLALSIKSLLMAMIVEQSARSLISRHSSML